MRLLIAIAVLALFTSCHAIKKTTTTVTKQVDSSVTVATHTEKDTASLSQLISGKDVDITIKYFDGTQLHSYADSFVGANKGQIEDDLSRPNYAVGGDNGRYHDPEFVKFSDLFPDHSRISEIDIHASSLSDSMGISRSSTTHDSAGKKEVVQTQVSQTTVEKIKAWWELPVEIGCGLILLLIILAIVGRKLKII